MAKAIELRNQRRRLQAEYTNLLNNYKILKENMTANVQEKKALREQIYALSKQIKEAEV